MLSSLALFYGGVICGALLMAFVAGASRLNQDDDR